ncbi:MAG: hypothetical protein OXE41_05750 [Gammaproteobacteria bacterium]|nr:hypothetical protein [Gammaproteobacteria bacterium]
MNQKKSKVGDKYSQIIQNSSGLDLENYRIHKKMEENLKKIGIERPVHGPKISDPAHNYILTYR